MRTWDDVLLSALEKIDKWTAQNLINGWLMKYRESILTDWNSFVVSAYQEAGVKNLKVFPLVTSPIPDLGRSVKAGKTQYTEGECKGGAENSREMRRIAFLARDNLKYPNDYLER